MTESYPTLYHAETVEFAEEQSAAYSRIARDLDNLVLRSKDKAVTRAARKAAGAARRAVAAYNKVARMPADSDLDVLEAADDEANARAETAELAADDVEDALANFEFRVAYEETLLLGVGLGLLIGWGP